MEIIIKPTDQIMRLGTTECRLWHGHLSDVGAVKVFVHRLAADHPQVQARLEQMLVDCQNPELTYIEPVFLDQSHALQQMASRLHSAEFENCSLKERIRMLEAQLAQRPTMGPGWGG